MARLTETMFFQAPTPQEMPALQDTHLLSPAGSCPQTTCEQRFHTLLGKERPTRPHTPLWAPPSGQGLWSPRRLWGHQGTPPRQPQTPGRLCTHTHAWAHITSHTSGTVSPFRAEQGTSLETPSRARASSCQAVAGPSVFPSGEPGVSGDFWGSQEGCQGPFRKGFLPTVVYLMVI